jgi:hypothetical protein
MRSAGKRHCFRAATAGWFAAALWAAAPTLAAAQSQPAPGAPVVLQGTSELPALTPAKPAASALPGAPTSSAAFTPPAASGSAFPPQPSPPEAQRGLLSNLGNWWQYYFGGLGTKFNQARGKFDDLNKTSSDAAQSAATATQEAMKNAAAATKDAAAAIARLPGTRVLEVRQRCANAANGAPDCQTAATEACRIKGFGAGKPLDIRSSESCPLSVYRSGRTPVEGECPEETVLLRAVCQ